MGRRVGREGECEREELWKKERKEEKMDRWRMGKEGVKKEVGKRDIIRKERNRRQRKVGSVRCVRERWEVSGSIYKCQVMSVSETITKLL